MMVCVGYNDLSWPDDPQYVLTPQLLDATPYKATLMLLFSLFFFCFIDALLSLN